MPISVGQGAVLLAAAVGAGVVLKLEIDAAARQRAEHVEARRGEEERERRRAEVAGIVREREEAAERGAGSFAKASARQAAR